MPPNKNQHYVPTFCLKLFSSDELNINGYIIKSKKHFSGPIAHQCAKTYFYKSPELDKELSKLEGTMSEVIKRVIGQESLNLSSKEYSWLLRFLSLAESRTLKSKLKAERFSEEFVKKIVKLAASNRAQKENLSDFNFKWLSAGLVQLKLGLHSGLLLSDLKPILLINNTQKEFICSDNPVVFYNMALNHIKGLNFCGFLSPGLQVFAPLSPNHMLILYDSEFYEVDANGYEKTITNIWDITALNKLQFYGAYDVIYYKGKDQADFINELHNELGDISRGPVIRSALENIGGREVLHTTEDQFPYKLNLSFIKVRQSIKSELPLIRNTILYQKFLDLTKS